jgi:bis(5'-nucleosyl)-tetraphosphatase (symmetrical)
MATYAIGDVQGCHDELVLLLETIAFDPRHDRLWFTGDLVNRGPKSAQTLRLIMSLGEAATVVLGNHDLFLLSLAAGHGRLHAGDTMQEVLEAPDREKLLDWLRTRDIAHFEDGFLMVHAGVLPQWTAAQVLALAGEVGQAVRHDPDLFTHMRGNLPDRWSPALTGYDRLRVLINAFARMRFITPDGQMEFKTKIDTAPKGYVAWDRVQPRATGSVHVIFGHWASRGLVLEPSISGLDSGCVWGRHLSAMRLSDRRIFQVECLAGPAGYSDVAP